MSQEESPAVKRRIRLASLMLLVALVALGFGAFRAWQDRRNVVYVQGDVRSPRKLSLTQGMTVTDALEAAGGPTLPASAVNVHLVRPSPLGGNNWLTLPVDLPAIVDSGDKATNYPIMPGDRLVIFRELAYPGGKASPFPKPSPK
jgi:protein involved in polysaccharide export with SLBB domain